MKRSLQRTVLLLTLLVPVAAQAQLYPQGEEQRGGGTVSGCDPSLVVDFQAHIQGGFNYYLEPLVQPGQTYVMNSVWSSFTSTLEQSYDAELYMGFPGPGSYPVCLTVNALDAVTFLPCSTSTCKLIEALPDSSCLDLQADFTIAGITGTEITFIQQVDIASMAHTAIWEFPDGSIVEGGYATFAFTGPGPHAIRLSLTGGPPHYCTSTVVKWLYLGPGNAPCEGFMEPGFVYYVLNELVGVLDTSSTAGLEREVLWNFGDGSFSAGNMAIHAYTVPGIYDLCRTLRTWGPMLGDTCTVTECVAVEAFSGGLTTVEVERAQHAVWRADPMPVVDQLLLSGPAVEAVECRVMDLGGRLLITRALSHSVERHAVDVSMLPPGGYLVELRTASGSTVLRMVKAMP
ncbi:MAG: hypothetical protein R2817_12445 [Flavobacteriales bacterium]